MKLALLFTVIGIVLLTAGLALSPIPWAALLVPGVAMLTVGLAKDVDDETD